VGLTKLLVEAKLCDLLLVGLTKLLVEALSRGHGCLWFYAFEKYWKIIWLTWCIMQFHYLYLEKLGVALFF
jgi:hypothetical protein